MFLNIITPCSRPENLLTVANSINIPKENYRWIIVFDSVTLPDSKLIPDNCEVYTHTDKKSIAGSAQRNFALELINDGYVYSNDDDTIMHPELWENIKDLNNDFISFDQVWSSGTHRLYGNTIKLNYVDSHNFIVHTSLIGDERFVVDRYDSDGVFAENCYKRAKDKHYINKVLSVYNSLR
jgi:hypothetical protein